MDREKASFGQALRQMRRAQGLSLRALAARAAYSPGWLSRVENELVEPTVELAQVCDEALEAGGRLYQLALRTQEEDPREWAPRPAQLPPGAGPGFVGRTRELTQLDWHLDRAEHAGTVMITVIDGPPGAGKTALAVRWAHQVNHRFPDGVLFTDLGGFSPAEQRATPHGVLENFLAALGVPARSIPPGIEQRGALLRSLVHGRRILIVADNAADNSQVRPLLLGAPGCAVVVTSRRRLTELAVHDSAARVALGPMPSEESVVLLSAAIGARADGEPHATRQLAQRCAHLPLALRIAAERLAAHPQMRVSDLVADLTGGAHRLDALATDQVTVRTAISWSYRQLAYEDPETARLFRLLSLLPERVTVDAVVAASGQPQSEVHQRLERLEAMHLIEVGTGESWIMHELLRSYARNMTVEEDSPYDRAAIIRRMVEWYVHTADSAHKALSPNWHRQPLAEANKLDDNRLAFDSSAQASRWFDAQAENFVPVVRIAAEYRLPGAWELPLRLSAWAMRRRSWSICKAAYEVALQAVRDVGERRVEAWLVGHLACVHSHLGDDARAQELWRCGQELYEEVGDVRGLAWTVAGLGLVAVQRGEAESARARFHEAVEIFSEIGDDLGAAAARGYLGESMARLGRHSEAVHHLTKALSDFEEMDERYGQGMVLMQWAHVAHAQGDLHRSEYLLAQSLSICRDAEDAWGEAEALAKQGHLALLHGERQETRATWRRALDSFEELDEPRAQVMREKLQALSSIETIDSRFRAS
ncbi:tetratricopeptide repeat protein [Streptomyces phytophilus]|uniref:tetratricopeptide repeat protein n=1 Tax=Streptomyces phytophilus TaxID=722715 RepID=UPI0015F0C4BA|nr:tetratricopeptide repeat protein [Streptomyces phytophilus]